MKAERPGLQEAWRQLRPGDTLVVWRLDRLGRSLKDLVQRIEELQQKGIGFRSLQEALDTTTAAGKLQFHVFSALAEFERELIRERTLAGLRAARARGRKGGRPGNNSSSEPEVPSDRRVGRFGGSGNQREAGPIQSRRCDTRERAGIPRATFTLWGAMAVYFRCKICKGEHAAPISFGSKEAFESWDMAGNVFECPETRLVASYAQEASFWRDDDRT